MPDYKAFLTKLHQNLNILQEREAKYGGNVPLELINQINDHQVAINLTERAIRGTLSEADWRESLQPLLIAIQTRTGELSSTVSLGDIQGGIHHSIIAGTTRDIHQQITYNTTIQQSRSEPDPRALREAYLNRLLERTSHLSLTGIDPKAASTQSEARLDLGAVYTALLTLSPEQPEELDPAQDGRRLSALAQLNQHPRLVLLGDPGSGKSTFIDFVTMCMAGELLGNSQANLTQLTAPLPDDEGHFQLERQPWQHGPLLPVVITLRDFAARGLPPVGQPATAEHLWRFIIADLKTAALEPYGRSLGEELHLQGGLLLLDGLDEVPEADQRRYQIRQAIEQFARTFKRCRIVVTSRTYAYQRQDWRLPGFAEAVLAPFTLGQIRHFVERWYEHMSELRGLNLENAKGRAELLKQAVLGNERLRALAERPLLLTLMASLHAWRGGTLPEKREELYADTVDLLLDWWESPKVVKNAQGQAVMLEPSLGEWLAVDRDGVRHMLNELAYQAHRRQPELTGTADIAEETLVAGMLRLSRNPDLKPARLVEYLSNRAGLLLPRGVGVYTFPHRTFQEYLAACHLTDTDYPDLVADLARQEPLRWREVALLAGAKAGRGSAFAIWALIDAMCYREPDMDSPASPDVWGALLAGQALVETVKLNQIGERYRFIVERVARWLVAILVQNLLPSMERVLAGDILARLGDPRPGVGVRPNGLPDISWCGVEAGPFVMGSDPTQDHLASANEQPQRQVDLPTFRIARYPITQAQYQTFIEAGGYQEVGYWAEAAATGYWFEGHVKRVTVRQEGGDIKPDEEWATTPAEFGPHFSLSNHPVVGINWYEAAAFCQWLTNQLHASGDLSPAEFVTLPSESQWEKAARGPLLEGDTARLYPWGHEPDPNRANYTETGLGVTSTVGCFAGGQSPIQCCDMSGNVWEWCRTKWQDNYENYRDNNEVTGYNPRVVRGGAYNINQRSVRCAVRVPVSPSYRAGNLGFRIVISS